MKAIVNALFDSRWLCEISKLCLSLINDVPVTPEILNETIRAIGGYQWSNGVTEIVTRSNDAGILDMLYNKSRVDVGQEHAGFVNSSTKDTVYLSTADLAELIKKGGDVTLVNWRDSVTIYEDIDKYLSMLLNHAFTDIHFQAPPKEDLDAFKNLSTILRDMVTKALGTDASPGLAKLQAGMVSPAIAQIKSAKMRIAAAEIKPIRDTIKSPYNFG